MYYHLGFSSWKPHTGFWFAVTKRVSIANPSPSPWLAVPASWLTAHGPEGWLESSAGGTFLEELFSSKWTCSISVFQCFLITLFPIVVFEISCLLLTWHVCTAGTQSSKSTHAQPTSSAPDQGTEHTSPTHVSLGSFLSLPPTRGTATPISNSSN